MRDLAYNLGAVALLSLVLLVAILGSDDEAESYRYTPVEKIERPELEAAAQDYWSARGYALRPVGQVYRVPSVPDVVAWAEVGGDEVWLTRRLLRGNPYRLCVVYIHERGHNLGLTHRSLWPIMRPVNPQAVETPRCR